MRSDPGMEVPKEVMIRLIRTVGVGVQRKGMLVVLISTISEHRVSSEGTWFPSLPI